MIRHVLFSATVSVLLVPSVRADDALPATPASIKQELHSFAAMATVLHVAAHPDDENTQLITYFARKRGYRTGYLSLTRGDGGQNESGPEFGEKLGVARTQELLAARRLDGGRQFFTRAIDFGYSKSPEETLRFWDRDQVLADVVRVIRQFRPDVIVTRFPVPPNGGGHGHHTASAILAVEAFNRAGDPDAYPDQLAEGLTPWRPLRVVWNGWGRGAADDDETTFRMDIGGVDPVTGEGLGDIAGRSRAMHISQGFGGFAGRGGGAGPNEQSFALLAGEPAKDDLLDGVETTWSRYSDGGAEIARLTANAIAEFKPGKPTASVPALLRIRSLLVALPDDPVVIDKRGQLDRIIRACLGLSVTTSAHRAEVVPGEPVAIRYAANLTGDIPVRLKQVRVADPVADKQLDIELAPGRSTSGELTVTIPKDTPLTQPYWLREEPDAGVFQVADKRLIGRPEDPPPIELEYVFEIDGQTMVVTDEPSASGAGDAPDRRLAIIAPVSMRFGSEVALFTPGATNTVAVELTAARAGTEGTLTLEAPSGWRVEPPSSSFRLDADGAATTLKFTVTAPDQPGSDHLGAIAEVDGQRFGNQRVEIAYAHIPFQLLQPEARLKVVAFDFATRGKSVGYLPGAGDSVADSLAQLGYQVTLLTGADLTPDRLREFDAVVIGVRAFNERTDLADNLDGLFAYVENGGTVVAQYNRPRGLNTPRLGPHALSIDGPAPRWRVTDETSPVSFLAPDHPALTTPNRLGPADFEGWVQERGAYFPSSWDETRYTPVLAMNDPGEDPLTSGVLIARHGEGHYVYTGLAFFRQLPAGVPGAHRLFANLVSLGK